MPAALQPAAYSRTTAATSSAGRPRRLAAQPARRWSATHSGTYRRTSALYRRPVARSVNSRSSCPSYPHATAGAPHPQVCARAGPRAARTRRSAVS